jgi:hypothetical protein
VGGTPRRLYPPLVAQVTPQGPPLDYKRGCTNQNTNRFFLDVQSSDTAVGEEALPVVDRHHPRAVAVEVEVAGAAPAGLHAALLHQPVVRRHPQRDDLALAIDAVARGGRGQVSRCRLGKSFLARVGGSGGPGGVDRRWRRGRR